MAQAKNTDIVLLLDFYGELLSPTQREALEYYYNEDLSLQEISEITGFTRQGIRDRIKKAEKILTDAESKLSLVSTFSQMKENIAKIVYGLEHIDECSDEDIQKMIELAKSCLD